MGRGEGNPVGEEEIKTWVLDMQSHISGVTIQGEIEGGSSAGSRAQSWDARLGMLSSWVVF